MVELRPLERLIGDTGWSYADAPADLTIAPLSPAEFGSFLADQDDLGTKSWPRFVRLAEAIPRTATNKVVKRELRDAGAACATWQRGERDRVYGSA